MGKALQGSWRDRARAVLVELRLKPTKDEAEIKRQKALVFEAYPFGFRELTPYKVWLDECKRMHPWLYPKPKQAPLPEWLRPKGGDHGSETR